MTAPPLPLSATGVDLAAGLDRFGDRTALVAGGRTVSYADLAGRVDEVCTQLGTTRRLVLLAAANTLESVTAYLAALAGGHPVLLAPADRPDHLEALRAAYDPDVVIGEGDGGSIREVRYDTAHELHPDLALLLSTSGSTGSPKLVRLSRANVESNAAAIAVALGIRPDDRAITSLPMHYCYGLSVLNSHLRQGASLVLSGLSVVDPCFWDDVRRHGVTTLAGVPHTYDLLDRVGFAGMSLPSLRCLTQAGGRMAPERVREYAGLGRRLGWDLFVMYGQTEATARMAVLPPDLALEYADSIGLPVPGGSFELDPVGPGDDAGELVYTGPNVMMGYAETTADLGRGHEVDALRTGDLARRNDAGLYEIVGRRSRFAKLFGLRIDLDQVERLLEAQGLPARCADLGDGLAVVSPQPCDASETASLVGQQCGIPAGAVTVVPGTEVPLLGTGKPDYPAMARMGLARREAAAVATDPPTPKTPALLGRLAREEAGGPAHTGRLAAVVALYAELLDRPEASGDSTFVGLGGDSLSYVEVSLRLEQLLGHLPAGWHLMPVRELADADAPSPQGGARRLHQVETGVVLRALAVLLILANHTHLADVPGGAHTLLGVAGYNFARFQLTSRDRASRTAGILRSAARVLVPSAIWIGGLALVQDSYAWHNPLMLNQVLGDHARWSDEWHFWFIEVLLYLLVAITGLLAIPLIDRVERRWPFALALGVVGVGLLTRYAVVVPDAGPYRGATAYVLVWLFALGWAAQKAAGRWQRLLVSALVVATVPGFWPTMPGREATIIAGLLLLVWVPGVRLPGWLGRAAGTIAGASLYVYLTHFAVYPYLMAYSSPLTIVVCVLVGVAYWRVVTWAARLPWRRWAGRASARLRAREV